ncbi:hypothetical protein LSAT2_026566 [Lamellibrachia satsuma]|nr:hypothetical protein LSAT2_026566 [Lamellibrachia satsuma]
MTHQLCLRPRKRSVCSPVARLLVQTPFQPRSTRKVAQLCLKSSIICFYSCGSRRRSPRSSKMLLSYTCTSEKEIIRSVTTTEVYPCSPLQARYLPGSCLTVSQRTLTRDSYQRASVDSRKSVGPPTWCLLQGKKCQEQNSDLFSSYVDLTKAFDTVSREGLWKIMATYRCPRKFISMVQQFHAGMQALVQDNGEISEPFPVSNGVKQGCILASILFSLMFSAMLTDSFRDGDIGIDLRYRTDGMLFNLRRLQAKTKVKTDIIRDFLFADDCALNAGSEADMQRSVHKFSIACPNFGLTISIKKTEVNGQRLSAVNRFTCLGSTLSQNVTIDDEVNVRIARTSATFGRLHANVWNRRGISLHTRLKVYRAIVLPTLLYTCETWTVYQRHAKKLNHFHTTCLRKLLNIKWQNRIPDTERLPSPPTPGIIPPWTGPSGVPPCTKAPRYARPTGQLQQSKGGKPGKPEPAILRMTSALSPVPTANAYTPTFTALEDLLKAIDLNEGYKYLPQIWSDLVLFEYSRREDLVEHLLNIMAKKKQNQQLLGRTLRVDHVANYKPPKMDEDVYEITKAVRERGCAPKASSDEELNVTPLKKSKKGRILSSPSPLFVSMFLLGDHVSFFHLLSSRQLVTSSVHRAKLEYHTCQIAEASGDQRQLSKIVAKLLHDDNDTPLPSCDSFDTLATPFSDFFSEKISKIRSVLSQNVNNVDASVEDAPQTCLLTAFELATEADIETVEVIAGEIM